MESFEKRGPRATDAGSTDSGGAGCPPCLFGERAALASYGKGSGSILREADAGKTPAVDQSIPCLRHSLRNESRMNRTQGAAFFFADSRTVGRQILDL